MGNKIDHRFLVVLFTVAISFCIWSDKKASATTIYEDPDPFLTDSFVEDNGSPPPKRRQVRIRKEFTAMSFKERMRFINAYKIVSTNEPFRRRYQYLVGLHSSLFRKVHTEKQFFPWHRWYLMEFENLLRRVDRRVTLPYWDWSLRSQKLWTTGIKDVWSHHPWGLGGNGSAPFSCVEKGPFNKHKWRLSKKSGGGCLRRNFMHGRMPSVISIHATLRLTPKKFKQFEKEIREFYHNELHCCIQGTMELPSASNTPEFILHHTFMDKIWYDWQQLGPKHKYTLGDKMESILRGSTYRVGQFMDSFNLVRGIMVQYRDPFPSYKTIHRTLKKLPIKILRMLDSHSAGGGKSCCPSTTKDILRKTKELRKSVKNIPFEAALDYGDKEWQETEV